MAEAERLVDGAAIGAELTLGVADADTTTRGAVIHARNQLDQVNANVIGAILNNFDPSKAKSSPYYYSYYYTYKYEEAPQRPGRLLRRRVSKDEGPYPVRDGKRGTGFERVARDEEGASPGEAGDEPAIAAAQRSRMEGLWAGSAGNGEEQAQEEEAASEPSTGRKARRRR